MGGWASGRREEVCGSNWDHKIANFVFLPYISFINPFTALECIRRYWDSKFDPFAFKTTLLRNYNIYLINFT